jgi:uncharacterized membrane protein
MDWLSMHWRVVLGVFAGFLAGACGGWVLGSYTACADAGCKVRVDAVEAVGTWVGGLGTIAAVLAAVVAFRGEDSARRELQARRLDGQQAARDWERAEAEQVRLSAQIGAIMVVGGIRCVTEFRVTVRNSTNESVAYKVRGGSPKWGALDPQSRLEPASAVTTRISLLGRRPRGEPLAVPADILDWELQMVALIAITFQMHGRQWKRTGHYPVEPVGG